MSLTAQTIRTLLAALALVLASSFTNAQTENKQGGSTIRGAVVYADTGRPLRYAGIDLFADVGDFSFTASAIDAASLYCKISRQADTSPSWTLPVFSTLRESVNEMRQ